MQKQRIISRLRLLLSQILLLILLPILFIFLPFVVLLGWIEKVLDIWHHWHGIRRIFGILGATITYWGFLALTAPWSLPEHFIPDMLERPVGCADDFIRLPDGGMAVKPPNFSRIQIYDFHGERFRQRELHFMRGWKIDSGGKSIEMRLTPENLIEVKTSYHQERLIYTLDGRLLERSKYDLQDKTNIRSVGSRKCVSVPTALLLWPFTNPFFAYIPMFTGAIISVLSENVRSKTRYDGTRHGTRR